MTRLQGGWSGRSIPARGRGYFILQNAPNTSAAHPTSSQWIMAVLSPGAKADKPWSWPFTSRTKSGLSLVSNSPALPYCVSRDIFTFIFYFFRLNQFYTYMLEEGQCFCSYSLNIIVPHAFNGKLTYKTGKRNSNKWKAMTVCVCVCVCVCARARARVCACICMYVCMYGYAHQSELVLLTNRNKKW